jgi:hypothetical protein
VQGTITPGGDYLVVFPEGQMYSASPKKVNDLMVCRSGDKGKTWTQPAVAFRINYSQHGFVPLIPRGTKRLYAFGTQPIPGRWVLHKGLVENAPIGFRWSDDDGRTWSDVQIIDPVNDPTFTGMSVMRMCETDAGTWLIGSHEGDWSVKPLRTRQYILRSEDKGKTWTLIPEKRPNGWFVEGFDRMDEGRLISLGGGKVMMMSRTPQGHLFIARSEDDGKTWSRPKPTPLVHPDAPPMLFHLSDGKTLAAFHHNRASKYDTLSEHAEMQKDRAEIWVATSADEGQTWSEPRFLFVNALAPTLPNAWFNYQCSYLDLVVDEGVLHLFVPHRWKRVLHLTLRESDLAKLPTRAELAAVAR